MVKVVIVEDNQSDEDQLRDHLSRYGRENGESFFITAYKSALDFLSAYKGDADMIFMDIELPDINGMDAAHRLIYHTDEGDFEVTGVLSKVEEKLIPFGFFRCNYCYLVNMNRVESVDKDSVMAGGDSLQISRSRKKDFLKALADYYGG